MIANKENEIFYNLYVSSPLAYQLMNKQGHLINVNQSWLKLLGYSKEEVIGLDFTNFLSFSSAHDWQKKWSQLQKSGQIWEVEYIVRCKNNALLNISLDGKSAYDEDNNFIGAHCILYDISERKRMEEKFLASEAHYRILAENMEDVVWRVDLQTMRVLYISPSVERLRGYTAEEVMQQSVEERFTPDSYAYFQRVFPTMLKSAISDQKNCTFIVDIFQQPCKDGNTVWVEISSRVLYGDDGRLEAIGVSRNYNKQKRQQQELADAIKRLKQGKAFNRTVMDTAPCLLSCIGQDGRIQYINKSCAEKFRKDQYSNKQLTLEELLPPHLHEKHIALLAECLQGASVSFIDEDPISDDPTCKYIYGVYNPFFSPDGEVEKVVLAAMDITEQKQMEKQLAEAQQIGKMGSWEWDLQKRYFTYSEGLRILFELDLEEVDAFSYHAFLNKVHPDDMLKVKSRLQQLLLDHVPVCLEFRRLCADGSTRVLQLNSSLSMDHNGNPFRIISMVVDITHYIQLEEAQKEAESRLREFAQTIPGIGFIVDEDGQVIELFGQDLLLLANTEGELTANELTQFMSKKTAEKFLCSIQQAIQMTTLQFGEYELYTKKGKRIFEARIAPMTYKIDRKRTVACNAIDITNQKLTQRILQTSYEKRRKRDLLDGLVEGKILPSQSVLDEAWRLKLNLAQSFSCYMLLVQRWQEKSMNYWQEHRDEFQFLLDSIVEVLSEATERIVWENKDGIVILNPLPSPCQDVKQYEQTVASSLQEIVHNNFPDIITSIGIAEFQPDTFWQLGKIYSQAYNAAYFGRNLCQDNKIHHYLDLGVFQIFPFVSDQEQVNSFIQRTIEKLVEYDQKKGSSLVTTLEKILQNDNLKVAAQQLFVHHKTIVFRKKRIEKILGVSLDDFETRLTLITALKLRQIFQA